MESQLDTFVRAVRGATLVWLVGPHGEERVLTTDEYQRLPTVAVADQTVFFDGTTAAAVARKRRLRS